MVKNILSVVAIAGLLTSCSSLKPLNFTSSKQVMAASATPDNTLQVNKPKNTPVRFIEDIAVTPSSEVVVAAPVAVKEEKKDTKTFGPSANTQPQMAAPAPSIFSERSSNAIESASMLQLKYAVLLNTEVEQVENNALLQSIDEWYGTRYRMGGMSKSGVDCSAFVQAVFATAFAITLPRTAREQYKVVQTISRTELKEGDLLFFNTRGGVSHVGMYLQNNKFIHASVSKGVTISDMFEPYYLQRFIGAGRIEDKQQVPVTDLSSSH